MVKDPIISRRLGPPSKVRRPLLDSTISKNLSTTLLEQVQAVPENRNPTQRLASYPNLKGPTDRPSF